MLEVEVASRATVVNLRETIPTNLSEHSSEVTHTVVLEFVSHARTYMYMQLSWGAVVQEPIVRGGSCVGGSYLRTGVVTLQPGRLS